MIPKKFLTFACTGQSGHTIIAAILDAHPNVMIGEEKHVVRKLTKNWTPEKVFEEVMKDSRNRVKGTGSYRRKIGTIEGQGTFHDKLLVLGDKTGWDVIGKYRDRGHKNEAMLGFEERLGVPVYVIHALRSPFDIISNWKIGKMKNDDMYDIITTYEVFAKATQAVYYDSDFPEEKILRVRNEDLCACSATEIGRICTFLELEVPDDYLDRCSAAIFKKTNRRMDEIPWTEEDIQRVNKIVGSFDFLKGYEHG